MASIQKQFEDFHENIKLKRFNENETLREKRNIIRNKIKEKLPAIFEKYGEDCLVYTWRDQGSYEIGTGIKPLNGDFDIDQGLYFQVKTEAYPDPVVLKKRVHEALDGHTDKVVIRRPCVTVFYHKDGESIYHVDIAIYSDESMNPDCKSRIAKGKENSAPENRFWEVSDPQALTDTIFERFKEKDRNQFRRIVRYLKRWKDVNFPPEGHAAPIGIGLTVAAYEDFQPAYFDEITGKPNDLEALRKMIASMLSRLQYVWDTSENCLVQRYVARLPVEPRVDLFEQMTVKQMEQFIQKLGTLKDILDVAYKEPDPVDACKSICKVFGSEFPIPSKIETARTHPPAIASSSNSA